MTQSVLPLPAPLALGGMVLIAALSITLIVRGTWQYLVYWASFCLNAWQAEEGQPIQIREAYQSIIQNKKRPYAILVGTYFALPLVALLPVLIMLVMGIFLGNQMQELLLIVGMLQSLVLSLAWLFSLILFSFVFQVAAFEKGIPASPGPTFMLSSKLALKRFWETLSLQLIVFLTANCLIPQPVVFIANLTRISAPLDWLHLWLIRETIGANAEEIALQSPLLGQMVNPHSQLVQEVAKALSAVAIGSTITLLLLPLGTLVFTLLYKDILRCDRSKNTLLGI